MNKKQCKHLDDSINDLNEVAKVLTAKEVIFLDHCEKFHTYLFVLVLV